MRIASSTIFNVGVFNMDNRQSDLYKLQNQLSTGRKVLTPSDDPVAAARSLDLQQAQSQNTQYGTNIDSATSTLNLSESSLSQVISTIQDIQTLGVQSGNPGLSAQEKGIIATSINSKYQQLMSLANATDGNGQYLFAGYQGNTKPFNELSFGNVQYNGDQGQRLVQISASRQVAISDSGSNIFENIKDGNGTYTTSTTNPDLPRTINVGNSGPIEFNRAAAGGYVKSNYTVAWNSGTGQYTVTRVSDGATANFTQAAILAPGGVTALGMTITAQGAAPTTATATGNFDGTLTANGGTGIISPGTVIDPVKWASANNSGQYRVAFHSVPDPKNPTAMLTSYDIIDNNPASANYDRSLIDGYNYKTGLPANGRTDSAANPNSYPRTYTPGADIVMGQQPGEATPLYPGWDFGARFQVQGVPADGDNFSIQPSKAEDLFTTVGNLTNALNAYQNNSTSASQFQNQLNTALSNLNNALTNVVTVQSAVGTRLKETSSTQSTEQSINITYQQTISGLTDLDYTKAISDFTQTQTYLDAARKSFASIQNQSLFQYIQG
ncbi:MAG: flagellar hook-associated protein FlgL [Burkholderiales bacterium]|nr:flagellar hook-associated protein FlgL [Burkholderiales bacterium]